MNKKQPASAAAESEATDGRKVEWISDREQLEQFCQQARLERIVAVDTEFHRERTYYARLALVQLATFDRIACVDPLAGLELDALDELMNDSDVLKIMHAGRQDLEIFAERNNAVPSPIFDTQIAAALLGLGEQIGYGPLVQKVCGLTLSKTQVRTDWMRRPLDKDVIRYAADDVRYLAPIYRQLNAELRQRGRREWLDEEQAVLLDMGTYKSDPDEAWEKVKGTDKLKGLGCEIARRVAAWRERCAQELDRPKRRILPDEIILDLARQQPDKMSSLERMRGLDDGVRKKFGQTLLDLVQDAVESPRESWAPVRKRTQGQDADDALVMALSVVLQQCARLADISPALLSSKSELNALAAGKRDLPILQGWRSELAGNALLDFLSGKSSLRCEKGRLKLEDESA